MVGISTPKKDGPVKNVESQNGAKEAVKVTAFEQMENEQLELRVENDGECDELYDQDNSDQSNVVNNTIIEDHIEVMKHTSAGRIQMTIPAEQKHKCGLCHKTFLIEASLHSHVRRMHRMTFEGYHRALETGLFPQGIAWYCSAQ